MIQLRDKAKTCQKAASRASSWRFTLGVTLVVYGAWLVTATGIACKMYWQLLWRLMPYPLLVLAPQVVLVIAYWGLGRRCKAKHAQVEAIESEKAEHIRKLREELPLPFEKVVVLLKRYDPNGAALKSPNLLMQEKRELLQIIDSLLAVRLCGACTHALAAQLRPVRSKLMKYRSDLAKSPSKRRRTRRATMGARIPRPSLDPQVRGNRANGDEAQAQAQAQAQARRRASVGGAMVGIGGRRHGAGPARRQSAGGVLVGAGAGAGVGAGLGSGLRRRRGRPTHLAQPAAVREEEVSSSSDDGGNDETDSDDPLAAVRERQVEEEEAAAAAAAAAVVVAKDEETEGSRAESAASSPSADGGETEDDEGEDTPKQQKQQQGGSDSPADDDHAASDENDNEDDGSSSPVLDNGGSLNNSSSSEGSDGDSEGSDGGGSDGGGSGSGAGSASEVDTTTASELEPRQALRRRRSRRLRRT